MKFLVKVFAKNGHDIEKITNDYVNDNIYVKKKENIKTIKNEENCKTTLGTNSWTKIKKRILKAWYKNYLHFAAQSKEFDM